ncbi:chaperone protein DNAj, putative [Trypanosoma equiperdum]|uniref:Chaperone protein DNAJ, putative n=2 Tax=Trypanozoon TaxID=39700 RepID=Q586W6_TRYB2|nr:chaperone protein DNAJ, putative [Trypanosoma brucei brucei TREU927]AAQ15853.1 chaperone protein DNAJ, putative [Trypanosoma brucei brucei TREU927]AAX79625.1 chaperone protein DNAJ, putative [Trypanosoma brucei]SCU70890.1 chaperone protein DNAj, putative [Trypanosoma equiperdum]
MNRSSSTSVNKDNVLQLTYYEIFSLDEVAESIDLQALHRAYRRFALLFHPDKDASPEAREAFLRVKLAAETLSDPIKRQEYNEQLRREAHEQREVKEQQRECGVGEEAIMAEMILRQKEAESLAKSAAANKEAAEREAAAKKMINELTNALTTPFKQMETALVSEWDIDEGLLDMKVNEIRLLLQKLHNLSCHREGRKGGGGAMGFSSGSEALPTAVKRTREESGVNITA